MSASALDEVILAGHTLVLIARRQGSADLAQRGHLV